MRSEKVLRIISQAKNYNKLPSEILGITNTYTAFCFNEACLHIQLALEDKDSKVIFDEKRLKEDGTRRTFLDMALEKGGNL